MTTPPADPGTIDVLTIDEPAQLKALGHPLRLRVLEILGEGAGAALTNRELAARIGVDPGHLHFHVRMLLRAGLIQLAERGSDRREKPYRAIARHVTVAPELLSANLASDIPATMLEEAQRGLARFSPAGRFRALSDTIRIDAERLVNLIEDAIAQAHEESDPEAQLLVLSVFVHPPATSE